MLKTVVVFIGFGLVHCDVFGIKQLVKTLEPPYKDIGYNYEVPTTTSSSLPEIIINKNSQNGQYLPPQYPPLGDPFPPTSLDYLPPDIGSPEIDYLPPLNQQDEDYNAGYHYDPPSPPLPPLGDEIIPQDDGYHYDPPSNNYLPPINKARSVKQARLRLQMNELKCLPNTGGFFKSVIKVRSFLNSVPVVEKDSSDFSGCNIKVLKTNLVVTIKAEDFQKCGVESCGNGNDLCLRLRFPSIRGMRTLQDPILTLQCRVQKRVVVKNHALKMGIVNDVQGRSAGIIAHGGSQLSFHPQLGIFRRGVNQGSFTRSLQPGGSVVLGEELVLRTQVRLGDGWNFTRVSDVVMQRLSSGGDILNSVTLIKSNGCVNPEMRSICPSSPIFEAPLGHRFGFRAAMFQGMKSGDEMVLNVKIVGCFDKKDCVSEYNCESPSRLKRSVGEEHETSSEISTISFRVELPAKFSSLSSEASSLPIVSISIISSTVLIALLALGLVLFKFRARHYEYQHD